MRQRKRKPKLGDVFQILLPDGRYAYGRVFRDASVGIYRMLSDAPNCPPTDENYQFIVGLYRDLLESGKWPIIANRRFPDDAGGWPPPYCIRDPISGRFEIYHKGQTRKASEAECSGLEAA